MNYCETYIEVNAESLRIVSTAVRRDILPLKVTAGLPTILVRKNAFERAGINRAEVDSLFNLTDEEFRVEGSLVVIGPLSSDDSLGPVIAYFEARGLIYYDEFFELSGNWPEWLRLYAM